jgi:DNA helicase HerA-like ATPase
MKLPNEQQKDLLASWNLQPKGFERVKVYVPLGLKESYEKAGIPVDFALSISPKEFSPEDWALAFNLERTSELAITLEKNVNSLLEEKRDFDLNELMERINADQQSSQHAKNVLTSFLQVASSWGLFSKQGMSISDIVKPNQVSVIDLSRVKGEEWGLRNLIAAWISREIYRERLLARKEEEIAKLEGIQTTKSFPMVWIILEEAHNFIPSDRKTVSTEPILTLAKQGREPGITVVCITQMPNKIHQDFLSQADIVISFRLTSEDDLRALHAVHQTYIQEELRKIINRLPRWPGACVIIDDTLERVFVANIRPRVSWHAGGTPTIT